MKELILRRFEWIVRALAQPAETQFQLFPDFVSVGDELAIEFEQWFRGLRELPQDPLKNGSMDLAVLLDKQLEEMSGPERAELWEDEAVKSSAQWVRVREIASDLIGAMGWPDSPPPAERDIYVGGQGTEVWGQKSLEP